MSYEVDFLAVGEGEKNGDATAIHFGNFSGQLSYERCKKRSEDFAKSVYDLFVAGAAKWP